MHWELLSNFIVKNYLLSKFVVHLIQFSTMKIMKHLIYGLLVASPFSCIAKTNSIELPQSLNSNNLYFIENKGQITDQYGGIRTDIQFKINTKTATIFIGNGAIHYQFSKQFSPNRSCLKAEVYRMDVTLRSSNPSSKIITGEKLPYYENYYKPNLGPNGARAYAYNKITYKDIYPGIDWVLSIKNNEFKYEFVVHNGANPNDIHLQYQGNTSLRINVDGSLSAGTPFGIVEEHSPCSFQKDGKHIHSAFRLEKDEVYFEVGKYKGELIIDPILNWATYYGGSLTDWTYSCYQGNGGLYLAGYSSSISNIATIGSYQQSLNGSQDAVLARFNSSGQLLWGTYYGGTDLESSTGVCCDTSGYIYMCGNTFSSSGIATLGSYQAALVGIYQNAFLVKFDSLGNRIWGTYYAGVGNGTTTSQSVATDRNGYIYLGGLTEDNSGIASAGGFQTSYGGGTNDGFLVKFDGNGVRLWATYYGGTGDDNVRSLSCDGVGNIYLSGSTSSTSNIATVGSYQPTYTGAEDAILVKFDGFGNRLWGTYFGGTNTTTSYAVTCTENDVYIGGITYCTTGIATAGSYQTTYGGGGFDAFLTKFTAIGGLEWSTYYGGAGVDYIYALTCNSEGVYSAGFTHSNTNIASPCGYQTNFIGTGSFNDAFFAKFSPNGTRTWGTYYGGDAEDQCYSIIVDASHHIYIAGVTNSVNGISTAGSYQPNLGGGFRDIFFAQFDECGILPAPSAITGNTSVCPGDTLVYHLTDVCEASDYSWILPSGWSGASNADSIIVIVGNTSGQISAAARNMCGDTGLLQSLNVTVHYLHPSIANAANTLSVSTFSSYQWYWNGQPIPGANSHDYPVTQNGTYYVVVTDGNGCSGNSDTVSISNVGIIEPQQSKGIKIFPNPANNLLHVYNAEIGSMVRIINVLGEVQCLKKIFTSMEVLDISGLPPGSYLVEVRQSAGKTVSKALIKNKN